MRWEQLEGRAGPPTSTAGPASDEPEDRVTGGPCLSGISYRGQRHNQGPEMEGISNITSALFFH